MGELVNCQIKLPKGLDVFDLDRKVVMKGLKQASKIVQQHSKRLISTKGPSKVGQYPGKNTGRMRRHVKVVSSKKKHRLWSRVQVASIEGSFFYPAVLNYGRGADKRGGALLPRRNFIADAGEATSVQTSRIIDRACTEAIKIWKK